MPSQTFEGINSGLGSVSTSAFGASTSSNVEYNILQQALTQGMVNQFCAIPANDAYAGKIYEVKFGGIYSTSATAPTLIITPRWGNSTTTSTNVTLGASPTTTMIASASSLPFYGQFTFVVNTANPGVTNGTGRGYGFCVMQIPVTSSQVALTIPFGGTLATIDTTGQGTAGCGLQIDFTWGTASTSNISTVHYWFLQSLN